MIHERNIDVLMLTECPPSFKQGGLLPLLNTRRNDEYHFSPAAQQDGYQNMVIYSRYASRVSSKPGLDGKRFTVRKIELVGNKPAVLLVAAHQPSKFPSRSLQMQIEDAKELSAGIVEAERSTGIARTLLVGDFNADPFEPGMIWAQGLHAMMTRRIATGDNPRYPGTRQTENRRYRMFYNPMWRHYGELNSVPSGSHYGTFYYGKLGRENFYWHMLDQALFRAELLTSFRDDSLEIVTQAGGISLLNSQGIPDSENFSDHLPITFELEL